MTSNRNKIKSIILHFAFTTFTLISIILHIKSYHLEIPDILSILKDWMFIVTGSMNG